MTNWTYGELDVRAHEAALALDHLGVSTGDRVAIMLPNRPEYAAFLFGIFEVGGVYTGIPVAYGDREATTILRESGASTLVIAANWRGRDYVDLVRSIRSRTPALQSVIIIHDDDHQHGEAHDGEWPIAALGSLPERSFPEVDPFDLCYLGFTSGTSGTPKGAMHNHETLLAGIVQVSQHLGPDALGDPAVQLVASPIGHHTGFHWGVLFNTYLQARAVYVDEWKAPHAADVIRSERATFMFGAPTFLHDLLQTTLVDVPECSLELVCVAGSPVPRSLPVTAGGLFGAYICPAWGMTELGINVSCSPLLPDAVLNTDGAVVGTAAAWVIDRDGNPLPVGLEGELVVDGPSLFLGYFNRPEATLEASTPEGGLRTGDRAVIDENGWVTLRGREKDLIIRGGENIPVADVESVVFEHPDVLNVAIVGYADDRLGERACAFVVLRPGTRLDREQLGAFLLSRGVAKHYLPERLEVLDDLPTTPSGKIRKVALRERLTSEPARSGDG